MMARRGKEDPTGLGLFPNWAWAGRSTAGSSTTAPRSTCSGQPWDPKRPLLKWNADQSEAATGTPLFWAGDVVDGGGGAGGITRPANCRSS